MKPQINTLQDKFQEYVLGSEQEQPDILGDIKSDYGLAAQDRLAIYYHAYRIRIRDALSEGFDKTHRYIGDELFYQFCYDYIDARPSNYRNLRWYGEQFPDFLAERLEDHPQVAELARFEWSLALAFDAADQPLLALDDLRSLQPEHWEHLGFSTQASLQFLELRSNAVAIWLALGEEQDPPEAIIDETPSTWLVWRKQLQPHFRSTTTMEQRALLGLREDQSFSAVCAEAAEEGQDNTAEIAGWLQSWIRDEILSAVRLR